jgi:serine/threonine protein kinase
MFKELLMEYERDSLLCYLSYLHNNNIYHNDVKLNNILLRLTDTGMVTLSVCDYGAIEHTNDNHYLQSTFPSPWLFFMHARKWFGVRKYDTTDVGDVGYAKLKDIYLKMHQQYFDAFDWGMVWDGATACWNAMGDGEQQDVRTVYRYNDRYGLGTVFLKLKEQEEDLDIRVPESMYMDLLLPIAVKTFA